MKINPSSSSAPQQLMRLLKFKNKIKTKIDKWVDKLTAFLDLSKALDSISHKILLRKLENLGFKSKAFKHTLKLLDTENVKVHVNGCFSGVIETKQGVTQGLVLRPLFFNCYINDLDKQPENNCIMTQKVIDTLIFCSNSCLNIAKTNLESDLNRLLRFFKIHKFTLNEDKADLSYLQKLDWKQVSSSNQKNSTLYNKRN